MEPIKNIQFYSIIKLQNPKSGRFLKESKWPSEIDRAQPLVVTTANKNEAEDWQVEPDRGQYPDPLEGQITSDVVIRLRNCKTQKRLHSHPCAKGTTLTQYREVTAYHDGKSGIGDDNDRWQLRIKGMNSWLAESPVELEHVGDDRKIIKEKAIWATDKSKRPLSADEMIVVCKANSDDETEWIAVDVRSADEYAKEQIADAYRTGRKSISLRNLGLTTLPIELRQLTDLEAIDLSNNELATLPEWLGQLTQLRSVLVLGNRLTTLPVSLAQLSGLGILDLKDNPVDLELGAAYKEGLDAVKRYLLAKAESQVVLNEAKLILVGEGEVGKSCLLAALRGDPWEEDRPTTHGIEIKPVKVIDPPSGTEIMLNGWDFGGQRVYRPTHQLFFSAPAVYLVVWKPREGAQQGFVKEWIKLIKHRAPNAKILVVATHGGPKERQPDIDRQEIWDLFGKDTVVGFHQVNNKPPNLDGKTGQWTGEREGIAELEDKIARIAVSLPEMGRTVPRRMQEARDILRSILSLDAVLGMLQYLVTDEAQVACPHSWYHPL